MRRPADQRKINALIEKIESIRNVPRGALLKSKELLKILKLPHIILEMKLIATIQMTGKGQ